LIALTLLNVILHDNPASGVRKTESACGWICELPQLMLWTAPPPRVSNGKTTTNASHFPAIHSAVICASELEGSLLISPG
jgi:hypothetical protein